MAKDIGTLVHLCVGKAQLSTTKLAISRLELNIMASKLEGIFIDPDHWPPKSRRAVAGVHR